MIPASDGIYFDWRRACRMLGREWLELAYDEKFGEKFEGVRSSDATDEQ